MLAPRWQLVVSGDRPIIEEAASIWAAKSISVEILNVSVFETEGRRASAELLFADEPDVAEVLGAAALKGATVEATLHAFDENEWRVFEPTDRVSARAGRFFVTDHPSRPADSDTVEIVLQRSEAFGVGEHPSTRSCLLVIDRLAEEGFEPASVLDLGCGSGVLSIAAAKVWPSACITGVDIEPAATEIAQGHARANHVATSTAFICADGVAAPELKARAPFDLVLMNILAGPLAEFAAGTAPLVSKEAFIVLAGFFKAQRDGVLRAYESAGFALRGELEMNGWVCLVLTSPEI